MHKGRPLPSNPYPALSEECVAYDKCVQLQDVGGSDDPAKFTPELCGRILGYMMKEAPNPEGLINVRKDIQSCKETEALLHLGECYATRLIRIFRQNEVRTSASCDDQSSLSFDLTGEMIAETLKETPLSNDRLKLLALKRDNYRCVVTGAYDTDVMDARIEADPTYEVPDPGTMPTRLTHIFLSSLNQNLDEKTARPQLGDLWSLEGFSEVDALEESLKNGNIRCMENVMTLCISIHDHFDKLRIWFEPSDETDTYTIRCTSEALRKSILPSIPQQFTFSTSDPMLPVPNPCYLALHAACAKVVHLSGAAGYFETVLREGEEGQVLASDGGSADTLRFLLARAIVAPH